MQQRQYHNILIIKLSSLGDVILASPCVVALRELYPQAKISWLVESPFADVVPGQPYVDEVIRVDKAKLRKPAGILQRLQYLRQVARELKQRQFDLVLDLQGLAKSAMYMWFTHAPCRIGLAGTREGSTLFCHPVLGAHAHGHVVDRYMDVVRYLGYRKAITQFPCYQLAAEFTELVSTCGDLQTIVGQSFVVLVPGTRWLSKCWPVEHYRELAQRLVADGHAVVVCGSPMETQLCGKVAHEVANVFNLAGETSLRQLMSLLQRAVCYVGGDTGPMHLAVAVRTPIVALYGPVSPEKNGPYGEGHIVISRRLPCMGCRKRVCVDQSCMKNIAVDEVYVACQTMIRRQQSNKAGEI